MPGAFRRRLDLEGAQHERTHGERQAEAREDLGIERGIDGAVDLRPFDDVDEQAWIEMIIVPRSAIREAIRA